jgi:hypothetical protein
MRECINLCTECHQTCVETLAHCLQLGGAHAAAEHIRILMDCAEICQTSANFMLRGSDQHPHTCEVCAGVCERCAKDCERLAQGDAQMIRCAEVCRRCANSCRRMMGSGGTMRMAA